MWLYNSPKKLNFSIFFFFWWDNFRIIEHSIFGILFFFSLLQVTTFTLGLKTLNFEFVQGSLIHFRNFQNFILCTLEWCKHVEHLPVHRLIRRNNLIWFSSKNRKKQNPHHFKISENTKSILWSIIKKYLFIKITL